MEISKHAREKIILAADDFGLNKFATKNILSLAQAGKLNRVAVMVNYPLAKKDIDALITSGVKIDLHLSLPELEKRTRTSRKVLRRSLIFLAHYFAGRLQTTQVEAEWDRQISRFIALFGKIPDGLNSHQYIHFFPNNLKIALRLAKKYGIPSLRFGRHSFRLIQNPTSLILSSLRIKGRKNFNNSTLKTTDYLVSLDWIQDFEKFLEALPNGQTELVCHPERKKEFEWLKKYF